MKNSRLLEAKKNKFDEFYTAKEDIEKELSHYKSQLKDKAVYCNCSVPSISNFSKFFLENPQQAPATAFGNEEGRKRKMKRKKHIEEVKRWH